MKYNTKLLAQEISAAVGDDIQYRLSEDSFEFITARIDFETGAEVVVPKPSKEIVEIINAILQKHDPTLPDIRAEFVAKIEEAMPAAVRPSVNSYILRLLRKATTTEEEKTFLAIFDAADLWEESTIAERDAALAEQRLPVWPAPPADLQTLINACK